MKRHVNFMSETAQFRAATRRHSRQWAYALIAGALLLIPVGAVRWVEQTRVRHQHEAMEASYEPVRRLNAINGQLRNAAENLVRDERLVLELSRDRPMAALLGRVTRATEDSNGQLFVQRLTVSQSAPGLKMGNAGHGRVVIEAAATLTYDVSQFVESLKAPPLADVKVTSDLVIAENGVDRKNYVLECAF